MAVLVPTVIPDAAYALLWLWILNPLYGPLNLAVGGAGLADAGMATRSRRRPDGAS